MSKSQQTPGTVLKSLMDEYQLSPAKLAQAIGLSTSAVYQISVGKTRVSASMALRFAKYFGQTPAYWLDLQNTADLAEAARDVKLSAIIKGISKAKKPKIAKGKNPAPAKIAKTPAKKTVKADTVKKAQEKKATVQKTPVKQAAASKKLTGLKKTAEPKKPAPDKTARVKVSVKESVQPVTPAASPEPPQPPVILNQQEDIPPVSQADTEN
jgi:addiction module HigA family antidote